MQDYRVSRILGKTTASVTFIWSFFLLFHYVLLLQFQNKLLLFSYEIYHRRCRKNTRYIAAIANEANPGHEAFSRSFTVDPVGQ